MEHIPQQTPKPHVQTPEEVAQFHYESRLQQRLAALAYPDEPVPLMRWGENEDGFSEKYRAWLDDPKNKGKHPTLDDEDAIKELFEELGGPTLH
jgi:hypothetical protein